MILILAMSAIGIYGLKFQNLGNYGKSNFGISVNFNDVQETHGHKSLTNVKPMGEDDWATEKSIGKESLLRTIRSSSTSNYSSSPNAIKILLKWTKKYSSDKLLTDIGSTRWILQDSINAYKHI